MDQSLSRVEYKVPGAPKKRAQRDIRKSLKTLSIVMETAFEDLNEAYDDAVFMVFHKSGKAVVHEINIGDERVVVLNSIRKEVLETLNRTYDPPLTTNIWNDVDLVARMEGPPHVYVSSFFFFTPQGKYRAYEDLPKRLMKTLLAVCKAKDVCVRLYDAASWYLDGLTIPIRLAFDPKKHARFSDASYYRQFGFEPENPEADRMLTEYIQTYMADNFAEFRDALRSVLVHAEDVSGMQSRNLDPLFAMD
jgi:hypothetical protein